MEGGKKQTKHLKTPAPQQGNDESVYKYEHLTIDEQIEIFAGIVVAIVIRESEQNNINDELDSFEGDTE